jgi:hypothetical protein
MGVVQALLVRAKADGWRVVGATTWKSIVKYRARGPSPNEERNVLGLVLLAQRANADVVAFVRDSDGDDDRTSIIETALRKAADLFPNVRAIGGVAVPVLEAWVLALKGERRTEVLSKAAAQARLEALGVEPKHTAQMVEVALAADLDQLPEDATRLHDWLSKARTTLHACAADIAHRS